MKILITGVAGFIGSHLAKSLINDDYNVIGIDNLNDYYDPLLKKNRLKILKNNKNFTFKNLDLNDINSLEILFTNSKPDKVVNLAAQAGVRYSLENPFAYSDSNLSGFVNIIELSQRFGVKNFVYASSSSVYGGNSKTPFSEDDRVDNPISLYASTKRSNELIANSYSHIHGLSTTGLRFFTVYGPWGRPDMALYSFTNNALKNKPIEIFNKGKMFRDFTYIDDVVNSIISLVKKKPSLDKQKIIADDSISDVAPYRVVNIGNSKKINLITFVNTLEKKLGLKIKKKLIGLQKGDVKSTYSDTKLLKKLINLKYNSDLSKGIKEFISWYFHYYKKNKKDV